MKRSKFSAVLAIAISALAVFAPAEAALAASSPVQVSTSQYPVGLAQNAAGDLFISDNSGSRLVVYPHGTGAVTLFGQSFTGGTEGTIALPSGVAAPNGLALDPVSGSLVFSTYSGDIWAMSPRTGTMFGVAIDQAHVNAWVNVGSVPNGNADIDFDSHGNLFVPSTGGGIFVLPTSSSVYGQTVTPNVPVLLNASALFQTDGDFNAAVAFDAHDNLYVTAMFGSTPGVYVLSSGDTSILGHTASTSAFTKLTDLVPVSHPCGIDVDSQGRVYFGIWGENSVYVISPKTETVFDTDATANTPVAIAALAGMGNQGVSVSADSSFIYSGGLSGTFQLENSQKPVVVVEPDPTPEVTVKYLADTGGSPLGLALAALGAILLAGGAVALRRR